MQAGCQTSRIYAIKHRSCSLAAPSVRPAGYTRLNTVAALIAAPSIRPAGYTRLNTVAALYLIPSLRPSFVETSLLSLPILFV